MFGVCSPAPEARGNCLLVVEIMTGVTRLRRGDGGTDCHASDVGHWLAMTIVGQGEVRGGRIATPVCGLVRNDNSGAGRSEGRYGINKC